LRTQARGDQLGEDELFGKILRADDVDAARTGEGGRQRAPDLRLEQDDGGEDDVAGDVADQPVDRVEAPPL